MSPTVGQLEENPEPRPAPRRGVPRADAGQVTPQPEQNEARIDDEKARFEIIADQPADDAGRSEDLPEPEDVLFQRMGGLGQDQDQEKGSASGVHELTGSLLDAGALCFGSLDTLAFMSEVLILREPAAHSLEELAETAAEPLRRAGAERAVAFGSYARGEADAYSDLDLVVVIPTELPRLSRGSLVAELIEALPVATDPIVLTPAECEQGMEQGIGIFDGILREGVTIYERR